MVPLRFGNLEMVLTLLTEVIVFHVQMTIVKIKVLELKSSIRIILSFDEYCRDLVSDPFNISPHELLKKVIVWQSWQSWQSG